MNGNQVIEINLNDILPNRFQPRIKFHEKNINELAESIREYGVIQPIVVRKISNKYEIIAGERRYKASVLANKTTIPALIVNLNDRDAAEVALIENVQRQDLTPIEEAVSYKKILDMGMTQEQLASKLGKTQSTVANKLRLLNLDEEVQEALLDQKISERHARSLLKLPTNEDQVKILKRIVEERLTVRKLDKVIKDYMETPKENTNEIEVLNLEDDENKKEIETMNENMNFNIPNMPIEEDKNQGMQTIPEVNVNPQPTMTNPGFMDVNKIESQAEDIFKEAPKADVENLLHQDAAMASMQPEEPKQEEPQGKFFTMAPEPKNENFVSDIEKVETNMDFIPQEEKTSTPQYNFDAFFNNNYQETPKEINEVSPKEVVTESTPSPVEPTPSVSQSFGINPEMITPVQPEVVPVVENKVESPEIPFLNQSQSSVVTNEPTMAPNENINLNPVEETTSTVEPTVNEVPNVEPIPNFVNPTIPTPQVENAAQAPQPSFPMFEEPTLEPVTSQIEEKPMTNFGVDFNVTPEMPTTNAQETPQDLGFNMDFRTLTPESTNVSTPTVEPASTTQSFGMNSEIPNPVVSEPQPTMMNNINQTPTVEVPTFNIPEEQLQPENVAPQDNNVSNNNVRAAIDLVRNCSNQIEALGYKIDVEEYDLENMYQVIFKIDK